MQIMIDQCGVRPQHKAYMRLVLWIALLAFIVQMLVSANHNHAINEQSQTCSACFIAGHLPSNIPVVNILAVPVVLLMQYLIVVSPIYVFFKPLTCLIPPSHAPPQ